MTKKIISPREMAMQLQVIQNAAKNTVELLKARNADETGAAKRSLISLSNMMSDLAGLVFKTLEITCSIGVGRYEAFDSNDKLMKKGDVVTEKTEL